MESVEELHTGYCCYGAAYCLGFSALQPNAILADTARQSRPPVGAQFIARLLRDAKIARCNKVRQSTTQQAACGIDTIGLLRQLARRDHAVEQDVGRYPDYQIIEGWAECVTDKVVVVVAVFLFVGVAAD